MSLVTVTILCALLAASCFGRGAFPTFGSIPCELKALCALFTRDLLIFASDCVVGRLPTLLSRARGFCVWAKHTIAYAWSRGAADCSAGARTASPTLLSALSKFD